MLSYRSTWEFVIVMMNVSFFRCASCFSTLLSCSYKFPRASISQHSMLTCALFLYYCAFFVVSNHSLSYYPTALSNIIVVQYKTGSLTGLGKLWQLHNMTTFGLLFIQFKGTRLTGFFPNQSKHSTTLVKHHVHVSCHAFCQLLFVQICSQNSLSKQLDNK